MALPTACRYPTRPVSSYVTTEPDGSRDVDVQSLFYDQFEMVRRIARMEQVLNTVMISAEEYAELKGYAKEAGATLGKLHAAQQRIAELKGERDRLAAWVEFVRYNSKDAAHLADDHFAEMENPDAN